MMKTCNPGSVNCAVGSNWTAPTSSGFCQSGDPLTGCLWNSSTPYGNQANGKGVTTQRNPARIYHQLDGPGQQYSCRPYGMPLTPQRFLELLYGGESILSLAQQFRKLHNECHLHCGRRNRGYGTVFYFRLRLHQHKTRHRRNHRKHFQLRRRAHLVRSSDDFDGMRLGGCAFHSSPKNMPRCGSPIR